MKLYFKPDQTKNNRNYSVKRRLGNGSYVFDQLPCEGIYTKHEMSKIMGDVPGVWVELPRRKVGFVFGLRQIIG